MQQMWSGCAEGNGEGEVISHLTPLRSEMLEYGDPRRQHGHPHYEPQSRLLYICGGQKKQDTLHPRRHRL